MNTPMHFFRASVTLDCRTTSPKWGDPISSSPSQTRAQIDGQLLPRRFERVQGSQECCLRAFLVYGSAPDADLAESLLLHDARFQRRRRPLRGIELLHVVHEVDPDTGSRAGIEQAKDAWLAGCGDDLHIGEAGLARQLGHVFRPLRIVAVLGSDRRQRDPVLKRLDGSIMQFGNFSKHGLHVPAVGGEQVHRQTRYQGPCQRAADKFSTVYIAGIVGFHLLPLPGLVQVVCVPHKRNRLSPEGRRVEDHGRFRRSAGAIQGQEFAKGQALSLHDQVGPPSIDQLPPDEFLPLVEDGLGPLAALPPLVRRQNLVRYGGYGGVRAGD